MKTIGEVAKMLDISIHTLRYYEKEGLIPRISKDGAGRRRYEVKDIDRVRFIKRAQRMKFSLSEIRQLIDIETAKSVEKPQAQKLVSEKLEEIEQSLIDLKHLKKDLSSMLSACLQSGEDDDCPIIEGIKDNEDAS
mgnify:CR=1 FL=1